MSTVLPNDTKLVFPSYTVVSASAGSGKTYTLTQRFVQLLLSDHVQHNGLRNILAITFTNQAASEMRRRLIGFLKLLALGDAEKLAEAGEFLDMPAGRIQEKARVSVETIFSEYSDLQIRTIDSFMAAVFKTSSFEFGFQPDLDIAFDNRPLLTEAFQIVTRELSYDPGLRGTLSEIVDLIMETRGKKDFLWDPYSRIQWEVRKLYSRLAAREKDVLPAEGIAEGRRIKAALQKVAGEIRRTIEQSNFEPSVYFGKDLRSIEDGDVDAVINRTRKAFDKIVKKPTGGIGARRYEDLLTSLEGPYREYTRLLDNYVIWQCRNAYKPYVDAISFISRALDELKKEKGEVFIDDINRLLRPHLREDRIPDAYLMLGEQIFHFLIDEFQDTSPIQWANLRPLIENSLSLGGSLFVVGDRKQSIYTFRNADWRIMDRLMKQHEFPSAKKDIIPLKKNWRSHEKIIRYVGHVFQNQVLQDPDFGPAAGMSGLDNVKQETSQEHKRKGVVDVSVMDWDEEKRPERERILSLITDCLLRGYVRQDIAILTPQNDRVLEVSSWLNEEGHHVLPYSSLDIRTRKVIGELIALLRFLDSPSDDLSFTTFLSGTVLRKNLERDNVRIPGHDLQNLLLAHAQERKRGRVYKKLQEVFPAIWDTWFKQLFRLSGYLPLYDLVAEIYRTFNLFELLKDEESSLIKFLEIAREFGEDTRNSLKDFVGMVVEEGEANFWQIQIPDGVEAIRVMTVHKAKGLEFPVVIVLLYDRDLRPERYFFSEEEGGIRLLRITSKHADQVPVYREILDEQKQSDRVDHLNKLYVALTRAQHEMYVVSLRGEDNIFPSRFLDMEPGELPLRPKADVKRKPGKETFALRHASRPVDYTVPSFAMLGFVEMERGDFIHRVLSGIEFLDGSPQEAIATLVSAETATLFPGLHPEAIQKSLTSFLTMPPIAPLFSRSKDRVILREAEFANRDGSLVRMDRVLLDPGLVTVIDFKTGSHKGDEHREQVSSYMQILKEIYPGRECRGILAYVDQCTVVKV